MAYTLAPFNPSTPYQNQVATELNTANTNFTILGQAFYNNDPSSNPVLRASYLGSSAPSNPVAGMIWLDTSGILPAIKVYDGSTWQLSSIRRINGNNLTSDYNLNIGEEAFYSWNTSASTSLNLHINTSGGIYQIIFTAQYNTSQDNSVYLYPNNTSYSNALTYSEVDVTDTSSTVYGNYGSLSAFLFPLSGSGLINAICSTYTDRKFMIIEGRVMTKSYSGMSYLTTIRWSDTSTAWSSLGTLNISSANGTVYVLVRRLA